MTPNKIKSKLYAHAKKYALARLLRHGYVKQRNRILSRAYRLQKIDPKTVVFESYNGRSYSCSPKAIYLQMLKDDHFRDFRFVWVFKDPNEHRQLLREPRTSIVKYGSSLYFKTFLNAKYWVVNSQLPPRIFKREGQIMLQCWHGTPLKRLRNDIVKNTKNATNSVADFVRKNNLDTVRYDYLLSPSRFATEKFTTAFGLGKLGKKDIILEAGYPRNDFLFTYSKADVARVKQELGIPDDKKVILYAPTWRDDQYTAGHGFYEKTMLDLAYLQEKLQDEYVLLYRSHYFIEKFIDISPFAGFVYNASKVDDVNDLYIISDVLITDYSSVFFDYANLKRPILFFMKDREHYQNELRGFYFDTAELPGDIVATEAQLVSRLNSLDDYAKKNARKYAKFSDKFNYLDGKHTAKKVIETVFHG